ncbi:alginate O-acetyltransferase, partial [Pseudomonas syringae pv. tagetis]
TQEELRTVFDSTAAVYRSMKELHDAFKRKGVELVVVFQPTRGLVDRNKLFPAQRNKFDYDKALKTYQAMLGRFSKRGYW